MKKCPYCAELVQVDAKKCKHCGEWFESKTQSLFKKAKGFGKRIQGAIEATKEHISQERYNELLDFLDSWYERGIIFNVKYNYQERLFRIVGYYEDIDIQIINRHTIKIDYPDRVPEQFRAISIEGGARKEYKGYLGVLNSKEGIGESMFVVLSDLYTRINGKELYS